MRYGDQTSDLREELRQYVGKEVALVVYSGSLRVVGRGELSLIDHNVKAVRVGDTTLSFDTWQAVDVHTSDNGPEPPTTSFQAGSASVIVGWYDLLISDYEE